MCLDFLFRTTSIKDEFYVVDGRPPEGWGDSCVGSAIASQFRLTPRQMRDTLLRLSHGCCRATQAERVLDGPAGGVLQLRPLLHLRHGHDLLDAVDNDINGPHQHAMHPRYTRCGCVDWSSIDQYSMIRFIQDV